ncbi:Metallo-dependent phosphatase [Lindgomyces ingoldianus]|uniref:Metallo-dependent phosphatase n=1 Tax=Lindgomyces ingoldianus TaxID=673940 RepID=A0ACB6QUJ6_9PLEO|nr:Metallo-dependent phosphatase [Lindgomyces ingoldianus]KAF2470683.1 Metallo-dependent phosphatase [Lindgomyces ingoldianus]
MSIRTRFLIISDTHGATLSPSTPNNVRFRQSLPKADVLLHCGDLTMVGHLHEYQTTLGMLADIDAELKLVIAGNHDISLDDRFYRRRGQSMHRLKEPDDTIPQKARALWMGEEAKRRGIMYLEEGVHQFKLRNGARLNVYASPYQPEFCAWAFPYFRNEDRFNLPHQAAPGATFIAENPVPDFPAIDVMMTHGPPYGCLDKTSRGEAVGCDHLLRATRRCRPRLHCFGHIHEAWGAGRVTWKLEQELGTKYKDYIEKTEDVEIREDSVIEEKAAFLDISGGGATPLEFGKETLMVNASVMTLRYRPQQAPWLVDLDLEGAE